MKSLTERTSIVAIPLALLLLGACGQGETGANPNPLAPEQEAGGEAGQGQGQGQGGDASNADRPPLEVFVEGNVTVGDQDIRTTVTTEAKCCEGEGSPYTNSPARFYLAPASAAGGDGFLLWLDAEDKVVLSQQSSPGVYDKQLHRSTAAAQRTDGKVIMMLPVKSLPAEPLHIWAATRNESSVDGVALPTKREDQKVPALLLGPEGTTAPSKGETGSETPDPAQ